MEIKIDKHIPPPDRHGAKWNRKYPWSDMGPGDSILVEVNSAGAVNGIRNNGNTTLRRLNKGHLKITYRRESENKYRFWVVRKDSDHLTAEAEATREYCG